MTKKQYSRLLAILTIGLLVFGVFAIVTHQKHSGKAIVTILVAPTDSTITIDDKKSRQGVRYLDPGKHTITASREHFSDAKQTIEVQASQKKTVRLLPGLKTQQAKDYINSHTTEETEREKLAGQSFSDANNTINKKYPYLNQLPILTSDFTISRGQPVRTKLASGDAAIALYIEAYTPIDRARAIDRIRTQLGVDPSSVEIVFVGLTANSVNNSQLKESE